VALRDVLALSKRGTRLELLCWELNVDESRVRPSWELARANGLVEPDGVDAVTGKTMFSLSARGRVVLAQFSRRRRA
jgi:hypothetical protein